MEYYVLAGAVKRAAECFPEPYLRCSESFSDYLTGIALSLLPESERKALSEAHLRRRRADGDAFCTSIEAEDRVRDGLMAALKEGIAAAACRFSGKTAENSTVLKAAAILKGLTE